MAGFFETVDEMGIVEDHAKRVFKLEETEAAAMVSRYRELRRDIRDRLDRLPGDRFTAQQLRGVQAQIDHTLTKMAHSLIDSMTGSGEDITEQGVEDILAEISAFSEKFQGAVVPINVNAAAVATDVKNFLFNRYQASISAYSESIRALMSQKLLDSTIQEKPLGLVVKDLGNVLQAQEWRLLRIGRTELHNIYGQGKIRSMQAIKEGYIDDLQKTLYHPLDDRTAPDSLYLMSIADEMIKPLDEPFEYDWGKSERIFMAPPDRPNDRAILIPYRAEWDT